MRLFNCPLSRPALARVLLLVTGLWLLPGCREPLPWAVYVSLKHAWYGPSLEPLIQAPRTEALKAVYVELGVFDPLERRFTDFQGALDVAPSRADSPQTQALGELAGRIRTVISPQTVTLGWIYLHRRPRPLDGQGGEASLQAVASPPFSLYDRRHRTALVETLEQLKSLGLDGVQLDLEPFPVSDVAAMQLLLTETRQRLGPGFFLSVFVPKFVPEARSAGTHPGFVWTSPSPYQALINLCDQVVVPLYDYGTLARTPQDYEARIREVEGGLLNAVDPRDRVWLALPAYRHTLEHGAVETLQAAARAVQRLRFRPGGVAIFVFTGESQDFVPDRDLEKVRF